MKACSDTQENITRSTGCTNFTFNLHVILHVRIWAAVARVIQGIGGHAGDARVAAAHAGAAAHRLAQLQRPAGRPLQMRWARLRRTTRTWAVQGTSLWSLTCGPSLACAACMTGWYYRALLWQPHMTTSSHARNFVLPRCKQRDAWTAGRCRPCRGTNLCRRAETRDRLQQRRHRLLAPRALVQQHLLRGGIIVALRSAAVQALMLRLGVAPIGLLLLLDHVLLLPARLLLALDRRVQLLQLIRGR